MSSWLNAQKPAYTTYTMEEGLPSLCVYDIIQAKDGAIWFATDNGVSRFDGYKFESFGIAEGLTHPDVFVLHEDDKGRMWCGVMNNELCYIEEGKVTRSKHSDKLSNFFDGSAIIQGIFSYKEDLYIAYRKKGLVHIDSDGNIKRINNEVGHHVFVTGSNENIIGLIEDKDTDPDQNLVDTQIHIYDKNGSTLSGIIKVTRTKLLGLAPKASSFGSADSIKIMLGTHEITISGNEIHVDYPEAVTNQIIKTGGWVWKGSQINGIYLSNSELNVEHQILPNSYLIPELCDLDGNVWVVEMGKGVHCFKPMKIVNYSNGEELYEGDISAITLDNNQLGVGYKNGCIEKVSIGTLEVERFEQIQEYILGINWLENELYAQTNNMAFFSRAREGSVIEHRGSNTRRSKLNCFRRILPYKTNVYSMVGPDGICIWDRKNDNLLFDSFDHGVFRIQDQLIDNDQNIWVTSERGVYLFDLKTETLIQYIKNVSVAGIVQLDDGDIWCSNGKGGILRFIPTEKKMMKVDLGITANETFIKQLRKDKNGLVWGTSNKGLFRIDPQTKKVDLIKKSDGLLSNLLKNISIDDEQLIVSTSKGISLLNINEIFESSNAPKFSISRIKLNGKGVDQQKLSTLNHNENNLEFKFLAIGFETPGAYNYRYRLKGLIDNWQYTTELKALFLSVPNGSYVFEVEAFGPRGGWSVGRTINVNISPPFWKTWWFLGGSMLLVISISFYFYKRRIRKLKQTNELKNEIKKFQQHAMTAQMNPHFIFNSMNSIQRFIIENERIIASEYLVKFSGLMRLTLENSKKIWVPVDEELKAIKLYLELEALRFKNKLKWKIGVAESVDQSLRIPTLLIQPFVENSIWHGLMHKKEGGIVEININSKDGQFFCEILDNGVGRDRANGLKSKEHKTMKSTGVAITKRRLELLHDESNTTFSFVIEDRKNDQGQMAGTRVYFTIPTIE